MFELYTTDGEILSSVLPHTFSGDIDDFISIQPIEFGPGMSLQIVCNMKYLTTNFSYLFYIGDNTNINNQAYAVLPRPLNTPKQTTFLMKPHPDISSHGLHSVTAYHEFDGECHIVIRIAHDGLTMDVFLNGVLYDEINGNAVTHVSNITDSKPMIRRTPEEISLGKYPGDPSKNLGFAGGSGTSISHFQIWLVYGCPPREFSVEHARLNQIQLACLVLMLQVRGLRSLFGSSFASVG